MCRIFVSPSKDLIYKTRDIWHFFCNLEKVGGKDGNGIYNLTTGELWKCHDKMPIIANLDGGFIFHTRLATNGNIADYNCQPFDNKRYVLVHNGVFSDIINYARMLGFPWSDKKYSDSYIMAWVLEKIGLFRLYMALKDERFGVLVIYDKETDNIYLMKGSGQFSYAEFKDQTFIYGSSALEFWKDIEDTNTFSNGLYILKSQGFHTLDRKKTHYYSRRYPADDYYGYDAYYGWGRGWDDYYGDDRKYKQKRLADKSKIEKDGDHENTSRVCAYCRAKISKDIVTKYYLYNWDVCQECYYEHREDVSKIDDSEPVGIAALFGEDEKEEKQERSHVEYFCVGCNWYGNDGNCWFGGIQREKPIRLMDKDNVRIDCNTMTSVIQALPTCFSCDSRLQNNDKWGIYDGKILCNKCHEFVEEHGHDCRQCEYYRLPTSDEPCKSCWNEGYKSCWTEACSDKYDWCEICHFEYISKSANPCCMCEMKNGKPSMWTSCYEDIEDIESKIHFCENCGIQFDDECRPYTTDDNKHVCEECYTMGDYMTAKEEYLQRMRTDYTSDEEEPFAYEREYYRKWMG